jgi:predicted metal-dependent phosphoesterase TrpH
LIDLHSHTTASDGTTPPGDLIRLAGEAGLEALAITDHDTLAGYEEAVPAAAAAGLDLICGIEISTKLVDPGTGRKKTVHLLGYFFDGPRPSFRDWIRTLQEYRRDRNRRLVAKLQSLGLDIDLAEVEAYGRSLTGRPHFARLLVRKGYVATVQQAFDQYLDESAKGFVFHETPTIEESVARVREGGGVASLAHPVRLARPVEEEIALIERLRDAGMQALEVHHSDHGPLEQERYFTLAQRFGLAVTGGSDFHGKNKPDVRLGVGRGNVSVGREVLDRLRGW